MFVLLKLILSFFSAATWLPLIPKVVPLPSTKKMFFAIISVRWSTFIKTKSYNNSSRLTIKSPWTFSLKYYPQPLLVNILFIAFLANLTVPDKKFFREKLLVGLCGQLFNSKTMHKFKIKLIYNEEELFCTKTELLNFKVTLSLAKLDMVGSRLV